MKKYIYGLLLCLAMLSLAVACDTDTTNNEDALYIDSPDPGDIQRPGGGGGNG